MDIEFAESDSGAIASAVDTSPRRFASRSAQRARTASAICAASSGRATSRSAPASARADANRRSRSRSSACRTTASTSGGVPAGSGGIGSSLIAFQIKKSVERSNSRTPDSASHSTTPSANTSVRASTDSPRICSGDMYGSLPLSTPVRVFLPSLGIFDTPKSSTLHTPSTVTNRFCGDTSRWITGVSAPVASRSVCA